MSERGRLAAEYGITNRRALDAALNDAEYALAATGDRMLNDTASDTLDELDEPLFQVIEHLHAEVNHLRLCRALAGKRGFPKRPSASLCKLVRDLDTIRLAAREAHAKRPPHRPKRADAHAMVRVLAEFWTRELGRPFKHNWAKTEAGEWVPKSRACGFIYDAVRFIAPEALPLLPTLTRHLH